MELSPILRRIATGEGNTLDLQWPVLDRGFVRLVDVMGDDRAIVDAARVSYSGGTRTSREDAGLIDYLMYNQHTSPFEMCEAKFHVKLPIFVARQWIRHRTANVNELSARYSILKDEFYLPEVVDMARQSQLNKQGRAEPLSEGDARAMLRDIDKAAREDAALYHELLEGDGLSRELARTVLPVSVYTEWYWKVDLHNLLHFLRLRMDEHAQVEIRRYAEVIWQQVVRAWVPMTAAAFEENVLKAVTLSRREAGHVLELARIGMSMAGDKAILKDPELKQRQKDKLLRLLEGDATTTKG